MVSLLLAMAWLTGSAVASEALAVDGADGSSPSGTAVAKGAEPGVEGRGAPTVYIREYRIQGAHQLSRLDVESAVYPFLGPGRTAEDCEKARAALEKAYQDKGYQTVSVQIPPQQVRGGVIILQVTEATVGRLRVKGSRYFTLDEIKREAPSMAEGKVVNFNDVTRDVLAMNQLPDRRVTPTLRAGELPGTVDIDLTVKDTPPLHGSLELNNRYSAGTTELRLNGSISYNNLWQLGHSLGFSFQFAPERLEDAEVFSGYYLARVPGVTWLGILLQATKQDSNVSTLGGGAVDGRGEVAGIRGVITLPPAKNFFHSLSLGIDYKHFDQDVALAGGGTRTPITYYPFSATYSASWIEKGFDTEANATLAFNLRGMGSSPAKFDADRFNADGGYVCLRGDLAHTHDIPWRFQIFAKAQGQVADSPLINSEQFSGGGLGTVRGYLESQALGDDGLFGSLELRSPPLLWWLGDKNDWRVYVFTDAGFLVLNDPLPEQQSRFSLASIGAGSRIHIQDHFNGSIDAGIPVISESAIHAGDVLLTFRLWADF